MGKEKKLQWGYINEKGETVIPPQYDGAEDFHEGLAAVKKDWARGYIDKDGRIVIPFQFEKAESFQDGVARVMVDGEWRYIDREGKQVDLEGEREKREEMEKETPFPSREGDKEGYVNGEGVWVIPQQFAQAEPFYGDYARVRKGKTSKWGFINKEGKFIFKETFEQAGDFHEGLARVLVKVEVE